MTDRDRTPRRGGGPGRPQRNARRGTGSAGRPDEPALPSDVAASDLDSEIRRDLLTLDKTNAENVARHLVMVTRLLDEDPVRALEHARAARGRAGRVGLVRETMGIAAYNAGEWQEALSELRAARRITGNTALLPLIADSERGLGRPARAIEIARSEEGRALRGDEATEMRIVESGARMDLGEAEKAVVTLQSEDLTPGRTGVGAARLYYAYASALEAAGRRDEAITWFMNTASADVEDVTDAELRLVELASEDTLDGTELPETSAADDEPVETAPTSTPSVTPAPAADEPSAADGPLPVESSERSAPAAPDNGLAGHYDALLLDLDGTVFAGQKALPGARESLESVGTPRYFVTNNASRRPAEVVAHLVELGFAATPDQVVTSAQSAARLLAEHLDPGSRALVIGTDGLAQEVREVGIGVTRNAEDRPAAVIQGHSPDTGWAQLSEAALAISRGALWVACNTDATLPSERGNLVGNGSMVAAVANATGQQPLVAGKPAAPLMADAIARSRASKPLVIGDRLDTDIEGAHSVGVDSALVLTGVSSAADLLVAPPEQRPTFVIEDLTGLFTDVDSVRVGPHAGWRVAVDGHTVNVEGDGLPQSLVPALASAVWTAVDENDLDTSLLAVTSPDEKVLGLLETVGFGRVR
ncbi:HAD-IIA family hydrolase [Gordonia sp. CPCC 206044]|uniref:HAD-IIA family hydrolase n=1 Tax=Gordonia sp. CPCC 206044 TaxID=3140793 RepID=UPI003AF3D77A